MRLWNTPLVNISTDRFLKRGSPMIMNRRLAEGLRQSGIQTVLPIFASVAHAEFCQPENAFSNHSALEGEAVQVAKGELYPMSFNYVCKTVNKYLSNAKKPNIDFIPRLVDTDNPPIKKMRISNESKEQGGTGTEYPETGVASEE